MIPSNNVYATANYDENRWIELGKYIDGISQALNWDKRTAMIEYAIHYSILLKDQETHDCWEGYGWMTDDARKNNYEDYEVWITQHRFKMLQKQREHNMFEFDGDFLECLDYVLSHNQISVIEADRKRMQLMAGESLDKEDQEEPDIEEEDEDYADVKAIADEDNIDINTAYKKYLRTKMEETVAQEWKRYIEKHEAS